VISTITGYYETKAFGNAYHPEAKPKDLVIALKDDLHCRNEILHYVQDDMLTSCPFPEQ
jgi:hypothetical protein